MATIYYPGGEPDLIKYYVGGTEISGDATSVSKLYQHSRYVYARVKVTTSISGKTASITVEFQMARSNGDHGTADATDVVIDGSTSVWDSTLSSGCAQRNNSEADTCVPESYFTTMGSKTITGLTCNESGEFSKSVSISTSAHYGDNHYNSNLHGFSETVTITFGGGASKPGAPTITVTDIGDNTFSISAEKGTAGNSNGTESITGYQYSLDNKNWSNGSSGSITEAGTIYGRAYTDGAYWDSDYGTGSATVKYYHKPSVRPTPKIEFTKKPTLKSNFTISWGEGSQYGEESYNAIKGYRIELFKDSQIIKLGTSENYIEVTDANSVSFNIIDKEFDIKVGDSIHATLRIWSENGEKNPKRLYYDYSNPAISNYVTIVNMGVVWLRIKNADGNDTWVEGQVWSRDSLTWNECTGLFMRDSSTWKESTN